MDRAGQAERGGRETLSKSQEAGSSERSRYSSSVLTDEWSSSRWRRRMGRAHCEGTCGTGPGVGVGHEGGRRLERSGWWGPRLKGPRMS